MELPKADPSSGSRTPSPRKGRSRSLSIRGSNPLDTPLTKSDFDLATLRKQILNEQEKEKETVKDATTPEPTPSPVRRRARSVSFVATNPIDTPITTTEFQLAAYRKQLKREQEQEEHVKETLTPRSTKPTRPPLPTILESPSRTPTRCTQTVNTTHQWHITTDKKGADKIKSDALKLLSDKRDELKANMNYQNYIDSPGGPGANSRQAPPSPSQGMNHPNGMNGGMGMGGMVGYPTPAGHQSDLNYIMSMVEDLSLVLRQNQLLTASVVEKVGKVREKASTMNMTNDELVAAVASELNDDTKNLEKENSELRKSLEKAEYDKKENWKLACHGANILADVTEKMHKFREQTDAEIHAWHKNYRQQLAAEREENLDLRNQINDMKAAACRANEHLRQMRRFITDHDEWHELRVQNVALRQEKRFWKRMAMPLLPDDDSEFSDDDDLIDPEEKKRQAALKEAEKERKEKEDTEGGEGTNA